MARIVIVEDEPATARNLEYTIKDIEADNDVIAKLGSVSDAVSWFKANDNNYDLIFMDIQLGDGLSFDIFKQVNISKPVIFVTAFDNYALQAFKANGIAYVLKPFDITEIEEALQKTSLLSPSSTINNDTITDVIEQLKKHNRSYRNTFLVHHRDRMIPVKAEHINWFFTKNDIVYAMSKDNKQYIIEDTLEHLQDQLDPNIFFRANRQFIIQKSSIHEVHFYFNSRLVLNVYPQPEEKIIISKAKAPEFKQWMNK